MSTTQQTRQNFAILEYDLSTDRAKESEFELIRLRDKTYLATLDVPDECYLHFHRPEATGIDLREIEAFGPYPMPIGEAYLENPTGSTGTLKLLVSEGGEVVPESTISEIESITGTVTTDMTSDITRSAGTVRDETYGSLVAFSHSTSGTTAEQLPSNTVRASVTVQADPGNTAEVNVGNSTTQPIQLEPGDSISGVRVSDTDVLHVQTPTSGDTVNVMGES